MRNAVESNYEGNMVCVRMNESLYECLLSVVVLDFGSHGVVN